MNGKKANEIIERDKVAREKERRAESANERHYRIYHVTPITSRFYRLPFKDIHDGKCYTEVRMYLYYVGCPAKEVWQAVARANEGQVGVCVKSRWTTYLVERLS